MAQSETGRGLRLLSLDGGGIRGLSELLIIEEIMKRVQSYSNLQHIPRPAEYFDLIGGTSTGGLIAILLGRLGLSAGEAIEMYMRLAERIFSEKKPKWQDGTFKATILESEIKKVVAERLGPEQSNARMLEEDGKGQGCRIFVCATPALNVAFRRRFRNYRVRRHEAYNCTIWEAGRATSAAPTFFKRIEIGGEQFVDAGLGCNNPVKEVIAEAQLVFGKERRVDCIVSIGTGKAGVVGFDKPTGFQTILPLDLVNVLKKMATESCNTAEEMEQRYEDASDFYFRFDVDQGLQDIGLDEWKQLGAVKTHTIAYTMETNVNRKIETVVGKLTGPVSDQIYNLAQLGGQIPSTKSDYKAQGRHLEPISNVPFLRDLDFVDRGNMINQIFEKLSHPGARVALLGFGGIGKSQLAIEYTHRVRDAFPQTWVFWVHASNQARMEEGFEQMARILDIPIRNNHESNIFQLVGKRLNDTREKWLLVLDNADDPDMFSRLSREGKAKENPGSFIFPSLVTPHLPHARSGSILVTSRNREASIALVGEDKNIIHVKEMGEEESLDLLFKKLSETVDRQGAQELVNALEHIPLAITQAAAFLSRGKGRISISQYVKDFNKSDKKKICLLKPDIINFRRDDEAANSIITTWQISFNHIRQNWPSAAEMLSLMSFFNYQGIPEFLLHDQSDSETSESTDEDTDQANDEAFEKRLQTLSDYCLISLGEDNKTFRMHRLVQTSTREWLKSHGRYNTLWSTYLRILSEEFPDDINDDWERWRQLLPHVESVGSTSPTDKKSAEDWAMILLKVSLYKRVLGEFEEAEQLSRNGLERSKRLFGEGHSVTLDLLHSLGRVLLEKRELESAMEMTRRALDGRKRLFGEGHASTLSSMGQMARVLNAEENYKEAETLMSSVLEEAQKQLPEDHPKVLGYLNILAAALFHQKRYNEAETIFRQVLERGGKPFQKYGLRKLSLMNNLATALRYQGKFQEAEEIHRLVLGKTEPLLGPNAPMTRKSRIHLVWVLYEVGKYREAEEIARQALKGGERGLGKEYPRCFYALAMALWGLGQFVQAERMFRQAMGGFERGTGKEDQERLECKKNLEAMLQDQSERGGEEYK